MVVQSIVFPLEVTRAAAARWLRAHGYRARLDVFRGLLRARQADPDCFEPSSLRTIRFRGDSRVLAVVGKLRVGRG
jgi:hypothetical protein